MTKFHVILANSGGELDRRTVDREDQTREAAIELIEAVAYLSEGDTIRVVETDR